VKKDVIKICEIFKSIQGEGMYQGLPAMFVRVSGCTRNCSMCDSKYHKNGTVYNVKDAAAKVASMLIVSNVHTVVLTGGEPLLYLPQIQKIIKRVGKFTNRASWHLETNGDLIKTKRDADKIMKLFRYVCISPKDVVTAERVSKIFVHYIDLFYDIKVVTDLESFNVDLVPYATALQPLTTFNKKRDLKIKQKVWKYCANYGLLYSSRLHIEVWDNKRGV